MGDAATARAAHKLQFAVPPDIALLAVRADQDPDLVGRVVSPQGTIAAADRTIAFRELGWHSGFPLDVSTVAMRVHRGPPAATFPLRLVASEGSRITAPRPSAAARPPAPGPARGQPVSGSQGRPPRTADRSARA